MWGLRIRFSSKLPGNTNGAGLGTTGHQKLGEPLASENDGGLGLTKATCLGSRAAPAPRSVDAMACCPLSHPLSLPPFPVPRASGLTKYGQSSDII